MHSPPPLPFQSQRRLWIIWTLTIAAGLLSVPLWVGLLTPLSWSIAPLNVLHYGATVLTGALAFGLGRASRYRISFLTWLLLAPSLLLALLTPFLWLFSEIMPFGLDESSFWDVQAPRRVERSPDGRLEARLYYLGAGFGGGTRANVKVVRSWLPVVVEDMGTYWGDERGAEAGVDWEGNSAVNIQIGNSKPERVPLNVFQWFPKQFLAEPFRFISSFFTR